MRLFRRSLLCLVVGVTAFGAAGLGFRPKPNWTVTFHETENVRLLESEPRPEKSDWRWLDRIVVGDPASQAALAFDSMNGELKKEIPAPPDFAKVEFRHHANGEISRTAWTAHSNDWLEGSTRISTYDAGTGELLIDRTFKGHAEVCRDGVAAWRVEQMDAGFRISVIDLASGSKDAELEYPTGFKRVGGFDIALSPAGDVVCFASKFRKPTPPKPAIEVWDVSKKARVRLITPPMPAAEVRSPHFDRREQTLSYQATDHQKRDHHTGSWVWDRWEFDLKKGTHVERDDKPPALPDETFSDAEVRHQDWYDEETLWTAFDREGERAVFGVFRTDGARLPCVRGGIGGR